MMNELRALVQKNLGLNESTEVVTEAVEENPFLNDDIILGYESSYPSFDEFVDMLGEGTTSYDDRSDVLDRDDLEESGNAPVEEKDEDDYLKSIDYYEDTDDLDDLFEAKKDDDEEEEEEITVEEDEEEDDSPDEAEEDDIELGDGDDEEDSDDEANEEDEVVDDEESEDEESEDDDDEDSEDEGEIDEIDLDADSKVEPPKSAKREESEDSDDDDDIGEEDIGDGEDETDDGNVDDLDLGDDRPDMDEPEGNEAPENTVDDLGDMSIDPDDIGFITNVSLDLNTNTMSDIIPVPPRNAETSIAEESVDSDLPDSDSYYEYEEISLFEAILGSDTGNDSSSDGEKKDDNSITSAVKDKVNEAESNSANDSNDSGASSDADSGSGSDNDDLPSDVDMDSIDGSNSGETEDDEEGTDDSDSDIDSSDGDIGDEDLGGDEPNADHVDAVSNALDQLSKVDTSLNDAKKALLKTLTGKA